MAKFGTRKTIEAKQPTPKETFLQAYDPQDVVTLTWEDAGVNTDVEPDPDTEINIEQARSIAIQVDTTHASHDSTDTDLNVESSLDGSVWDTVVYAEVNLGDAEIKTFLITPGPSKIRLRLDQNEGGKTAYVTAKVLVRR